MQVQLLNPGEPTKQYAGARLKHSQAAHNGKLCLPRDATRLPFIQKNKVGRKSLGQKNRATFTCEALACLLQ